MGGAFRAPRGRRIHLQASCPRKTELRGCPLSELQLRTDWLVVGTGTGNVYPIAVLRHVRGPPCVPTGLLELAVENPEPYAKEMFRRLGPTQRDHGR